MSKVKTNNIIQEWNKYIIRDFYSIPKENETIINYPHFRALQVINEKNIVRCSAILEKSKNKYWKYLLYCLHTGIVIKKYVTPFRATKKNREMFNKISNRGAKKLINILEKNYPDKKYEQI